MDREISKNPVAKKLDPKENPKKKELSGDLVKKTWSQKDKYPNTKHENGLKGKISRDFTSKSFERVSETWKQQDLRAENSNRAKTWNSSLIIEANVYQSSNFNQRWVRVSESWIRGTGDRRGG